MPKLLHFTMTPAAVEQLRIDLAELLEPGDCLRVSVVGGGDSGLQFGFAPDLARPDDVVMKFDGLTVIVDPVSAIHLKGYTLDGAEGGFVRFIAPC